MSEQKPTPNDAEAQKKNLGTNFGCRSLLCTKPVKVGKLVEKVRESEDDE